MKKVLISLLVISALGLVTMITAGMIFVYNGAETFDLISRIGLLIFTAPLLIVQMIMFTGKYDKIVDARTLTRTTLLALTFYCVDIIFVLALNSLFGILPNWRMESTEYGREFMRQSYTFSLFLTSATLLMGIGFISFMYTIFTSSEKEN